MADTQTEQPTEPTPALAAENTAEPEVPAEKVETKEEEKPAETAENETTTESGAAAATATETEVKPEESKEETKNEETKEEEAKEEEPTPPEPIDIPEGNGELVLVTGVTGYLASHIFKLLVESNQYKVRGSVRKIEENEKLEKLRSLVPENSKYGIEFVEADLTNEESWIEAVKGCEYVIHTASPFPVTEPQDANEVIEPARDGTLSVMKACATSGTVKRVVLTSSIVAISSGRTIDRNACTEEMWTNVDKSPSAYDKSKTIAEKAAWDYIKEQLPEGCGLELSVVNPGFIVGPPLMKLDCTSVEVIKKLMNREHSILPKISFALSDVRDVALAHIRAMVIKQAAGHRHIVCGASVWLKDMANIMSQEFNSQGFNIPTTQAPYVLVWIKSQFDPVIKRLLPSIGKMYQYDNKRMLQILQVEPREFKDSLVEMGHAMINLEIVQKVEKKQKKQTIKKKKEKELDDGEEKKDEPEKAASTSGSAENASVPDAVIEDVEITVDDSAAKEEETKAEKPEEAATSVEEVKAEGEEDKPAEAAAAAHSEEDTKDEATTSDPESSKKKDKKEKPKKEKKEKKKGGIFSFSFKKSKKPHVEKKTEEAEAAAEDKPAEAATEETPAATEETPAATEETPTTTEATPAAADVTPAATEDTPATAEETPAVVETPAAKEAAPSVETPAAKEETSTAPKEEPAAEEKPAQEEKKDVATEEPKTESAAPSEPAANAESASNEND